MGIREKQRAKGGYEDLDRGPSIASSFSWWTKGGLGANGLQPKNVGAQSLG